MHENNGSSIVEALMLFVAGAAVGGLLVALNTPKTGPELCEDLKAMGRRAKGRAEGLTGDAEDAVKKDLAEIGKR